MVKKCGVLPFCPVANLRLYVDLCDLVSIDLRDVDLFRSTNKKGAVSNKPFIGSSIAIRLSLHLYLEYIMVKLCTAFVAGVR